MAFIDEPLAPFGGTEPLLRLYAIALKSYHRTVLNWLVFGSALGEQITGHRVPEPTQHALNEFVVAVELMEPNLRRFLQLLIHYGPRSASMALQRLIETDLEWSHPVQILDHPRPTLEELEATYKERYEEGDRSPAFLAIGDRVKKAAALARKAEERRRKFEKKSAVN